MREAEQQYHEKKTAFAVSQARGDDADDLRAEIARMDHQISALSDRHAACCLAIETLTQASEAMRASVLPNVIREAGENVNRISSGAFDGIGVEHDLTVNFTRGTQTKNAEYLSAGTKDIAYISLRRAMSTVLFGGECPPLIYDESLSRIDETRLARILHMLREAGKDGAQSIVLSCRSAEQRMADGAHLIRM